MAWLRCFDEMICFAIFFVSKLLHHSIVSMERIEAGSDDHRIRYFLIRFSVVKFYTLARKKNSERMITNFQAISSNFFIILHESKHATGLRRSCYFSRNDSWEIYTAASRDHFFK